MCHGHQKRFIFLVWQLQIGKRQKICVANQNDDKRNYEQLIAAQHVRKHIPCNLLESTIVGDEVVFGQDLLVIFLGKNTEMTPP